MIKFNPDYELIIGRPSQVNDYLIPKGIVSPQKLSQGVSGVGANGFRSSISPDGITNYSGDYIDYNTIPSRFYSIRDLQIVATLPDNSEGVTAATFEITNLPEEVTKFARKDDFVAFRVGYLSELEDGEDLPDIYIGQIQKIVSDFPMTDKVTKITCGAGRTIRKNSRISYSWPPGTTREAVIRDMLSFMVKQGLPVGNFTSPTPGGKASDILSKPFLSGYSVQGVTWDELSKLLKACRMQGFISKGRYFIQPIYEGISTLNPTPFELKFNITPSDVKGTPQLEDGDNSGAPSNANGKANQKDIKVTIYLDSRVGVESVVNLSEDFEDYAGDYKVTSLLNHYDHRGGVYETRLSLTGI